MVNVLNKQLTEMAGETSYITQTLGNYPLYALKIYGKSTQDGTPTPEAPVTIASIGDDGAVEVTACGKNVLDISKFQPIQVEKITINDDNIVIAAGEYVYGIRLLDESLLTVGKTYTFSVGNMSSFGTGNYGWRVPYTDGTYANTVNKSLTDTITIEKPARGAWFYARMGETATEDIIISKPQIEIGETATPYEPYTGSTAEITSGLPLCSVGDVRDELIYNADGTGKVIKRTAKIDSYNSETITTDYVSSTGGLDTGATVVYALENPIEIELSATEMAVLQQLHSFSTVTNIDNNSDGEMYIRAMTAGFEYGHEVGFFDSKIL